MTLADAMEQFYRDTGLAALTHWWAFVKWRRQQVRKKTR